MNEELRDLAEIALRIAKADLERDGSVTALFILRDPDGSTHQLPFTKEYADRAEEAPARSSSSPDRGRDSGVAHRGR